MNKPTILEQFRRGGSYYTKQRPPRLLGAALRVAMLWLVVPLGMYPMFGAAIFTRPYLMELGLRDGSRDDLGCHRNHQSTAAKRPANLRRASNFKLTHYRFFTAPPGL